MLNDWYIYANGKVEGPLPADALLKRGQTGAGKGCMVSRQGFSRWYPLDQLAELMNATQPQDLATVNEIKQLQELVQRKVSRFENARNQAQKTLQPKTPTTIPAKSTPALAEKVIKRRIEAELAEMTVQAVQSGNTTTARVHTHPSPEPVRQSGRKTSVSSLKQDLAYQYTLLRGRLRLGRIRNPFFVAFVAAPLTLLLYWGIWFGEVTRELAWHFESRARPTSFPPAWLAFVPGIHLWMSYRLGQLIIRVEKQNHYTSTLPTLCAVLAIFPPFCMYYLQSALNKHWRLHVKHYKAD